MSLSENNGLEEEEIESSEEKNSGLQERDENQTEKESIQELRNQLEKEEEKTASYEKKIQYLLADFENLKKRTDKDVQNKVDSFTYNIILKFLSIYDDFIRAKTALSKEKMNTEGFEGILRNMDALIAELGVEPIQAVGEIFDPKLHEAISVTSDPELDDNTITKEIRKGYILKERVIRPSLVEISKKRDKGE